MVSMDDPDGSYYDDQTGVLRDRYGEIAEVRGGEPSSPTVVGSWCLIHRRVADLRAEHCPDYCDENMDYDR